MQEPMEFIWHYRRLLDRLVPVRAKITSCGLLPVSSRTFPGSFERFVTINEMLRGLAEDVGVEYLDWGEESGIKEKGEEAFYRDGFHPNKEGAALLGKYLFGKFRETQEIDMAGL